jgi:hypothetical protein
VAVDVLLATTSFTGCEMYATVPPSLGKTGTGAGIETADEGCAGLPLEQPELIATTATTATRLQRPVCTVRA